MVQRILVIFIAFSGLSSFNPQRGDIIDSFNSVPVYYNGSDFTRTSGRNVSDTGYNLGLKFQCVEFVKRYYYEIFNHEMPDSYGNAKEFFDTSLPDVAMNHERGLMQYRNVRNERPRLHDIIIYDAMEDNPFGHMGIVTKVDEDSIEYIQQNFGRKTRQKLKLVEFRGIYTIADYNILGWLRMPDQDFKE